MTDKTEALPPLPEPDCRFPMDGPPRFRADQMRDYARAVLAQRQQVPENVRVVLQTLLDIWHAGQLTVRPEAFGYWNATVEAGEAIIGRLEQLKLTASITAAPSAQAEPQEPLTDEQIVQLCRMAVAPWIEAQPGSQIYEFGRAIERAHGIGKT